MGWACNTAVGLSLCRAGGVVCCVVKFVLDARGNRQEETRRDEMESDEM